jgi:hypothetical protein
MTADDGNIDTRSRFRLRFSLLALFIFITLICFVLAWLVQRQHVHATALFRVASRQPSLLDDNSVGQINQSEYRLFKDTQRALVKSYYVLNAAVRKPGIATLSIFRGRSVTPEEWIEQHLEVDFPHQSEFMQIRLRGIEGQGPDLARIVDAVAQAYSDEAIYKERARQSAALDLLNRSLEDLRSKIAEKSELMLAIAKDGDRHDEATAGVLQQVNLGELERVDLELMRLESEQLKLEGGDEDSSSKFYETRIAQLRKRQAEIMKALIQETEPSAELNALKREIEELEQLARELAMKVNRARVDSRLPARIELVQPAVVSAAD